MTQAFKPNIFNIPSNYHFFDSLIDWLNINFGNKISDIKILFPNRRACREFQNIFVDKLEKHKIINTGQEDLKFIEIQNGEYFGEDDIVRLEEKYGRK